MRAVVQRVRYASVTYVQDGEEICSEISTGLQVLLGITHSDSKQDVDYMVDKIAGLRIFEDEDEKMNRSLADVGGQILLVSQFTLYGDARKGKRPSFTEAARPEVAIPLYEYAVEKFSAQGILCQTGKFGAEMLVQIHNDGPVTILLDSKKIF